MNLVEEIDSFFKKNPLDDFAKIRYIYLVVCDTFSYDTRYMYALSSLKKEIYEKEIDIKNVTEYEFVCRTYAKILKDLLEHFGYKCYILNDEYLKDSLHVFAVVEFNNRRIKLDPTIKHDTTRVKMNAETYDFRPFMDDPIFEDDLKEADEQINLLCNNRFDPNKRFMATINELAYMSVLTEDIRRPDIMFFNKLHSVFNLVNMKSDFDRYDDIDYYFSYILKKSKINERADFVKPAVLFNLDDPTMKDMINLILVEFDNFPPVFYVMERGNNHYYINSISGKDVLKKLDKYSNWQVDYYYKDRALKAVDSFENIKIKNLR